MLSRLYAFWLHFLRFHAVLEFYFAECSGNRLARAAAKSKISDIDGQLDRLSLNTSPLAVGLRLGGKSADGTGGGVPTARRQK